MLELDHFAVAGMSLEAARSYAEERLQMKLKDGGEHDVFFTHNALLGLEEGLYLEAIAINPNAPTPKRPRWFDLDRFTGASRVTNWICRCDDIEAVAARFPEAGAPVSLSRGDLRWRMMVPKDGILPFDNMFPAIIQWDSSQTPPVRLGSSGMRLDTLTISHPDVARLQDTLGPLLSDARLVFREGPAGLTAQLSGPKGSCTL